MLYPKLAKLLIVKFTIGLSLQKEALINKGLQLNLMLAVFTKEQGLAINPLLELLVEGVNRLEIPVYRTTTAAVAITNL